MNKHLSKFILPTILRQVCYQWDAAAAAAADDGDGDDGDGEDDGGGGGSNNDDDGYNDPRYSLCLREVLLF